VPEQINSISHYLTAIKGADFDWIEQRDMIEVGKMFKKFKQNQKMASQATITLGRRAATFPGGRTRWSWDEFRASL
jgi:hypothetical protein